jgi:sugar/nucleoside kinase (ribokinase family)
MLVMDVVGFGSLCIDFVFKVDKYPKRGSSNLSRASVVDCGGTIGNFLMGWPEVRRHGRRGP